MRTATIQPDLKTLEERLQDYLQTATGEATCIQIRCKLDRHCLHVLGQSLPGSVPDPEPIFNVLAQAIETFPPDSVQQVKLYLRLSGQRHPYAVCEFPLRTAGVGYEGMTDLPSPLSCEEDIPETLEENAESEEGNELEISHQVEPEAITAPPGETVPPAESTLALTADGADDPDAELLAPTPADEGVNDETLPEEEDAVEQFGRVPLPVPILLAGMSAAASLVVLSGGIYLWTRPCALRAECPPVEEATTLYPQVEQALQVISDPTDLAQLNQTLHQTVKHLEAIPRWSAHQKKAQPLLQRYRQQAKDLDRVLAAMGNATQASTKSQSPPHPLETWQAVHQLWQKAIAELDAIPPNSPIASLAVRKKTEYQANLAAIAARLGTEQQAQRQLTQANTQLEKAAQRQADNPQSFEDWQQIYRQMQSAIASLQSLPEGTLAAETAQQVRTEYEPQLIAVRDRKIREETSAKLYNEAVNFASQAREAEQQEKWSVAADHWQTALSHTRQVAKDTQYYKRAQMLAAPFKQSMETAIAKADNSGTLQKTRDDLAQVCSGTPKICTYALTRKSIEVRTTVEYEQLVDRTLKTNAPGNAHQHQAQVKEHVRSVLNALTIISDNSNTPLTVYNADGSLFGTHTPGVPGYVQAR